jgi:hypothetical protein
MPNCKYKEKTIILNEEKLLLEDNLPPLQSKREESGNINICKKELINPPDCTPDDTTQTGELIKLCGSLGFSDNYGEEIKESTLFPTKSVENIVLIYNSAECKYEES